MAIEDVNADGRIKSMGGAKLEALLGDAQLKPEVAASLVDQFAEAGASGFTGCFSSSLGLAATQAAANTIAVLDRQRCRQFADRARPDQHIPVVSTRDADRDRCGGRVGRLEQGRRLASEDGRAGAR